MATVRNVQFQNKYNIESNLFSLKGDKCADGRT